MKRVDFKKQSSVFYIGKGLIIGSVVITASLGFLLGFLVGKQVHPLPETPPNSSASLPVKEPAQNPEVAPVTEPLQQSSESAHMSVPEKNTQPAAEQQGLESRAIPPVQPGGSNRDSASSSAEKARKQAPSQSTVKAGQAQTTKPSQGSPEKKDSKSPQDKQEATKIEATRKYTVQVGAFKNAEEADALRTKMSKKGYKAFVTAAKTKKQEILHKVMVGEYKTRREAEVLSVKLKNSEGLRTFVTFVMKEGATRQH
jgi:cell division septation protein DedD